MLPTLASLALLAGCGSPIRPVSAPVGVPAASPAWTVADLGEVPCAGGFTGAACRGFEVACPGIDPLAGTLIVIEPPEPRGTVLLFAGEGGVGIVDPVVNDAIVAAGFRTVQASFAAEWELTEPPSIRAASCRPTAVIGHVFAQVHGEDRDRGFCAFGHSAGAGAVAYALAFGDAGDLLDHVVLSAGPVFSRLDHGCDPPGVFVRDAGCDEIPKAVFVYSGARAEQMGDWSGEDCGPPTGDVDREALLAQSILVDDAVLHYPRTRLDYWWCRQDFGGAVGQGSLHADAVTSETERHCAVGCLGEPAWQNDHVLEEIATTLVEECVPRHAGTP